MKSLLKYRDLIETELSSAVPTSDKHILYEPIKYIISLGGKRVRPAICLLSCESFGGSVNDAVAPAIAVELFHNFSLLHDDIMDNAPLRRGKISAHEKWSSNQAILSGDALFALSNKILEKVKPEHLASILKIYNQTALEVCIGQQMDMEFEDRNEVHHDEYIEMIRLKTSVLLGAALKMGAISARADEKDQNHIYDFGVNLGIAFQLRDDYLDSFATNENFGKQIGGDILADKKTYLNIRLLEKADEEDSQTIMNLSGRKNGEKVKTVLELYKKYQIDLDILGQMNTYSEKSLGELEQCGFSHESKQTFRNIVNELLNRDV